MTNIKEGGIFQSLMLAFTFVRNYCLIGTVEIVIVFALIAVYLTKIFVIQSKEQETGNYTDWKMAL